MNHITPPLLQVYCISNATSLWMFAIYNLFTTFHDSEYYPTVMNTRQWQDCQHDYCSWGEDMRNGVFLWWCKQVNKWGRQLTTRPVHGLENGVRNQRESGGSSDMFMITQSSMSLVVMFCLLLWLCKRLQTRMVYMFLLNHVGANTIKSSTYLIFTISTKTIFGCIVCLLFHFLTGEIMY